MVRDLLEWLAVQLRITSFDIHFEVIATDFLERFCGMRERIRLTPGLFV